MHAPHDRRKVDLRLAGGEAVAVGGAHQVRDMSGLEE